MPASVEAIASSEDAAEDPSARRIFEILAREHADMLASYLRSLVRSSHAVDDLFQDTMITAWQRLDSFDTSRPFGPWLRGIATRKVLKYRERAARDVLNCDPAVLEVLEERFEQLSSQPRGFSDSVRRLLTCLKRLPTKLREAIQLAYQQGLFLRQVALRLEVSEEAIKKRVQRGRQLLADCVQAEEVST